jgi:hypothetical protein
MYCFDFFPKVDDLDRKTLNVADLQSMPKQDMREEQNVKHLICLQNII